jgi:hypothetical protein
MEIYEGGKTKNVTSFEDLKSYAGGMVVELPPFAEGQPFVAKLRRPSLLALAKAGRIPNQLLHRAGQLFNGGGAALDSDDGNMLSDIYDISMVVVKASLVSPTLDEIHEAGLELSDDQVMAIFNYTQSGVNALKQFREQS